MKQDRVAEIAKTVSASEQQVAELANWLKTQQGTLTTKVNTIVTHTDGSRHWSSANCEQCS